MKTGSTEILLLGVIIVAFSAYILNDPENNPIVTYMATTKLVRSLSKAFKPPSHVIVVGGGVAGLSAAIEAARTGAYVTVLDKEPRMGGNSAKASSGINAVGTVYQREAGIDDSVEKCRLETRGSAGPDSESIMIHRMCMESASAIAFLETHGVALPLLTQLGGHSLPRTHRPAPPTKGPPLNTGLIIVKALTEAIQANYTTITFKNNHKVVDIIADKQEIGVPIVRGVKVAAGGQTFDMLADGIVITTGGFGASPSKIKQNCPSAAGFPTTNGAFATGDGLDMGAKIGTSFRSMNKVQIHPTGFVDPADEGASVKWLAPEAFRGAGALLLKKNCRRFVNELGTRKTVSDAIVKDGFLAGGYHSAFIVLNDASREIFDIPGIYLKKKFLVQYDSAEEAAVAMGCKAEDLVETLEKYSAWQDDVPKPTRPTLFTKQDKLYVGRVSPSVHYTMGGLRINTEANVVYQANGMPIGRLWAAGEATGGLHGENRLAGNGLLDNIVFGRIAGRNAARNYRGLIFGSDPSRRHTLEGSEFKEKHQR